MASIPEKITNVTVPLKANVYFDGGVVSHSLIAPNGSRQTVGLIRPGQYRFNTEAPERMDIIAGQCEVKLAGETASKSYSAGQTFHVPGNSSFEIRVNGGLTEYLCTFE